MGRVRGKGKKRTIIAREDQGRPEKPVKDDAQRGEELKVSQEDVEEAKDLKTEGVTENGRKRKGSPQVKGNADLAKEENGVETKPAIPGDDSTKFVGFRHIGSRRKNNTPRRAAEAGVECM